MMWVPLFVESLNQALLGDIYSWDLEAEADPLRRVLHLRLQRHWQKKEVPLVRELLREWAKANDCVYRRSFYKNYTFKALIMLKGLSPKKEVNPMLEEPDARRRN
jgi:hypothetical protein